MISKELFEHHLSHIKCDVKSCGEQAIFIEDVRNLDSPLTKKINISGFMILCKNHHQTLFQTRKGTTISFVNAKGELVCNRCGTSWKNTIPEHKVPVTCKLCNNLRWNRPYTRERIEVGVK